jgi:phage gp29-like protein
MPKTPRKGGAPQKPKVTPPNEPSPLAGPVTPGGGQSASQMVRKSNLWRDNYNPLMGLTMRRLVVLFEMAERGAGVELQLLLRKAEKRYPVLKGFIERLVSSLEELDWDVKPLKNLPAGATPAMADAQAKFLKGRYNLIKNLKEAIGQVALADIRGYAVLQKHRYDNGPENGAIEELYWLEPWVWSKDGYYGDFYYNEISRFGVGLGQCQGTLGEGNRIGSAQLPREEFVIREVESPLYEIALIAFVNWLMGRKDWAAFVEIFGLPKGVVIMPPNIPAGEESAYQTGAEKVSDGVSGALPHGSDIKFPTSGVRGESPFSAYCQAQDADLVMAATSGLLAMLSGHAAGESGGLGHGPNKQHADIWEQIAKMKGNRVNEVFRKDIDAVELAAAFPGQPVCVQFILAVQEDEDVKIVVDTVVALEGAGLQTDVAEVSQRTGFTLKRVQMPADAQIDPAMAQKADAHLDKSMINQAVRNRLRNRLGRPVEAVLADLAPLRNQLTEIENITDPDLQRQALASLESELAGIHYADSALSLAIEGFITEELERENTRSAFVVTGYAK